MGKDESFEVKIEWNEDDQEVETIPEEILDLVRYLAKVIYFVSVRIGKPVIKGAKNQEAIKRIAAQKFNQDNISAAVDLMLKL